MALKHPEAKALLRESDISDHTDEFNIDEGHCIEDWGKTGFRTAWDEMDRIRSYLRGDTPVLWQTATATTETLSLARERLKIDPEQSFHLNLGNDRSNITPIVIPLPGKNGDLSVLRFLVAGAKPDTTLVRAIIFFKERFLTQKACIYLRSLLPEEIQSQIDYLHSKRTSQGKQRVMSEFHEGKINILCATNCAGMGQDIRALVLSIHYLAPGNNKEKTQFAGRAGRDGTPARFLLFTERSIYQEKKQPPKKQRKKGAKGKSKKTQAPSDSSPSASETEPAADAADMADAADAPEAPAATAGSDTQAMDVDRPENEETPAHYRKKLQQALREWITTLGCRRDVDDVHYQNPSRPRACAQRGCSPERSLTGLLSNDCTLL
jgi:superfamily II DNA helicase RecQ